MPKTQETFTYVGKLTDTIDVKISHRIIQLFSEGLYSSSHKAIEELVSNAFDAGAHNVHVILSPDLYDENASIAVIDDGEGMDVTGLKQHWIIGHSSRRKPNSANGRKPIGKFGIGKLATYVLATRLTHICKSQGKFFATTMDYSILDQQRDNAESEGVFNEGIIRLPLHELAEEEAKRALETWTTGTKSGYQALRLFGENACGSWTVAIMSGLTEMGKKVQRGRLKWILRTAMPLRDDFKLYLDGDPVEPARIDSPVIQRWVIGKDITKLGKPCPDGFDATEDESFPPESIHRYGLSHDELGRITGYVELYEDELTGSKSEDIGRSNGFFVYVRDRMINTEDPGFGIERNLLRHGTFSRLRVVVHIDSLDEELRSSRESLRQGERYNLAKNFLRAVFNLARNKLIEYEKSQSPGALIAARVSSAPGSMTRKPLLALAQMAIEGKISPFYTRLPSGLSKKQRTDFLEQLRDRAESEEGLLRTSELVSLSSEYGIAVYDLESGILQINLSHPFVACFQEEFAKAKTSLPLEMFVLSEILTEAHLYYIGLEENQIRDILARRDELFRQLVRSSGKRNLRMISLALQDAKDDPNKLEEEMRAAFEAMGFANVIRLGGKGKPDGTAEAHLPATEEGKPQRYKVGLEAKSGGPVTAQRLGVSGIARHMKEYECDHHLVIGNQFNTATADDCATVKEIKAEKSNTGKTITLMHIDDFARLVRLVPPKRIGLSKLRELFRTCIAPEESKRWIDSIAKTAPNDWPYKAILDVIWKLANMRPYEAVEYAAVCTELMHCTPPIDISKKDLIECCKAMQVMAKGVVFARETTVEIDRRPDLILEDIRGAIGEYPEEERKTIRI